MKRLVFVVLLLCLAGLLVGSLEVKQAKAVPIEVNRTFTSQSYDGQVRWFSTDYSTARTYPTGGILDEDTQFTVGQTWGAGKYWVYRGFLFFDTSVIPSSANITGANLSVYISYDGSDTDFNATIQSGQPTYPHSPLQMGDYYYLHYTGDGGSRNTSDGLSVSNYWNISLNEDGLDWINTEGTTKLCLRSNRDIDGTTPTGDESVTIRAAESGEAYAPKLYVTYETEGYHYVVHGPYWESGANATTTVNVTLSIENTDSYNFVLNGTTGNADVANISVEQRGVAFTWNFTSTTNYTRVYYLIDDAFEEIWIFIPNVASESVYLYTFEINNFAGVGNPYMETIITVGGQNRIVERQSAKVVSSIPFYMVYGRRYTLRLISDEGSYTWGGYIALSDTAITLTVRGVDFPKSTLYKFKYVRVYGLRAFGVPYGNITVIYEDLLNMTNSVTIYINYVNGSNAYNATETQDAFVHEWLSAANNTDYCARIVVDHERYGVYEWKQFFLRTNTVNPWESISFLGDLPFDPAILFGALIIVITGGAFSVLNPEIGAFAACAAASFLVWWGWLPLPIPLLVAAWAFTFLFALVMAKRRVKT